MSVTIRTADPEKDAERILEIYAPYIEQTAITFEYDVPSLEEFRGRMAATLKAYPYIVLEEDGNIQGYAYCGIFHERQAYAWDVETSIYLAMDRKGRGYGRRLYDEMERILKKQHVSNVYACIAYADPEDEYLTNDSQHFHEHLGYTLVGRFKKCGFKFSTWYDMIWMEKMIGDHPGHPEDFIPFPKLIMSQGDGSF